MTLLSDDVCESTNSAGEAVAGRALGASRPDLDQIQSELSALVHELSFLVDDLENGLDIGRGTPARDGAVSLIFQEAGIEATLWLAGNAFSRAKELRDRVPAAA